MLSLFPDLLWLSIFAPFILRVSLGLILFGTSFHQLVDRREATTKRFMEAWPKHGYTILWVVSVAEIVLGLSLVAGMYTQGAALITAIMSFIALFSMKYKRATNRDMIFYTLMLAISLSLVILGAGAFSFDLPL